MILNRSRGLHLIVLALSLGTGDRQILLRFAENSSEGISRQS
jgi:hypothetical protein